MPRVNRRGHRLRSKAVDPWIVFALEYDLDVLTPRWELEEAWRVVRRDVLATWSDIYLFIRPAGWWAFERPDLKDPHYGDSEATRAAAARWWLANAPEELTQRERRWIRQHKSEVEAAGQEAKKRGKVLSIDKGE